MKKLLFFCLVALLSGNTVKACDICGCGAGNNYIGILPEFSRHIVGIRYRYNSMYSHVGVGGASSYLTTRENYRITELWGGWNIGQNFRLMTAIPYSFAERLNQGDRKTKNGIGDMSVGGYYQLINTRKTLNSKLLIQNLWIGTGVKFASGKYNPVDKSSTNESANLFQLGTGSTDFLINAMYDIRLQDAGLSASGSYKINTANKYDYEYGNKWSFNTQAYYKFRVLNKFTIAPNAGVMYETSAKDGDKKFSVDISGGSLLLGTVGLEATFEKITIGGNFQTPFSQHLANGIVKANDRAMVHVSFLL